MWEELEADAKNLREELGIGGRAANALASASFKTAQGVAIILGPSGHKLALIRNIGEKSCQEIAWALWKHGYLTYKLQTPVHGRLKL
jgi:hypothetical protein